MNKKIKISFLIAFIAHWSCGCAQRSVEHERISTILKVVDLVKRNDTGALYKVIDTLHVYKSFGKENYMFAIKNLNQKFSNGQLSKDVSTQNIKPMAEPGSSSYELLLYSKEDNSKFYRIILRFIGNEYRTIYSFQANYNDNSDILQGSPTSRFK